MFGVAVEVVREAAASDRGGGGRRKRREGGICKDEKIVPVPYLGRADNNTERRERVV